MSKVPADAQYVITPHAVYGRDMEIPEGFEYVNFGIPSDGDIFLSKQGCIITMGRVAGQEGPRIPRIIVRRVPLKPHPFDSGGRRVTGGVADRPCVTCGLPDRDPIHKVAKPRRWIVEQSPDDTEEPRPGQILRRSQWRVIREVQPITREQLWEALAMDWSRTDSTVNGLVKTLKALGIEVED